jgi:hypothetical protein
MSLGPSFSLNGVDVGAGRGAGRGSTEAPRLMLRGRCIELAKGNVTFNDLVIKFGQVIIHNVGLGRSSGS